MSRFPPCERQTLSLRFHSEVTMLFVDYKKQITAENVSYVAGDDLADDFRIILISLYAVTICFGSLGSICVLVVFIADRSLWKVGNVLIANLALSDLLQVTIPGPIYLYAITVHPAGLEICHVSHMLRNIFMSTCFYTIVTIAVGRYVLVCHSSGLYHRMFNRCSMVFICLMLWMLGCLWQVEPLLLDGHMAPQGCNTLQLEHNKPSSSVHHTIKWTTVGSAFVLSYLLVVYLYYRMARRATRFSRKISHSRPSVDRRARRTSPPRQRKTSEHFRFGGEVGREGGGGRERGGRERGGGGGGGRGGRKTSGPHREAGAVQKPGAYIPPWKLSAMEENDERNQAARPQAVPQTVRKVARSPPARRLNETLAGHNSSGSSPRQSKSQSDDLPHDQKTKSSTSTPKLPSSSSHWDSTDSKDVRTSCPMIKLTRPSQETLSLQPLLSATSLSEETSVRKCDSLQLPTKEESDRFKQAWCSETESKVTLEQPDDDYYARATFPRYVQVEQHHPDTQDHPISTSEDVRAVVTEQATWKMEMSGSPESSCHKRKERSDVRRFGFVACAFTLTVYMPYILLLVARHLYVLQVHTEYYAMAMFAVLVASVLNCLVYGYLNTNFQMAAERLLEKMRGRHRTSPSLHNPRAGGVQCDGESKVWHEKMSVNR